jgi:hypothetical protein
MQYNFASPFKKYLSVFLLAFLLMAGSLTSIVFATTTPPSFPTCESKIFSSDGDWAHYDSGIHGVVGVGNLEGKDDVYSLSDGNFLQCYCPSEGTGGIQSNWWNVERAGLSQSEIDSYQSQGWFKENGSGWNLYNETYLIQNRNFSCEQVTPTPTNAPSVTPTPGPEGPQSRCFDLEATPLEGTAPLTVKFTGHADDPATGGKIKEYKFDYGDASGGQPQVWSQTDRVSYHRYEISGEYTAKLDIQDNAGNWRGSDDCRVTIKVNSTPQVLGTSSPDQLPSTGLTVALMVLIPSLTGAGFYLHSRFRLI